MSECTPPSMFYGKRITRGKTKSGTERDTCVNASTTKALKTRRDGVTSQKSDTGDRQLRSILKKTSKKPSEPAITALVSPSSKKQCNLRIRKNAKSEDQQKPSNKRRSPVNVKIPQQKKDPVYKQASVESTLVKNDAADEYEFEVVTPEGAAKKPKKRQQRVKSKMQTLWGLTIKSETKKKLKPSKKVVVQESENVKPVNKVIQQAVVSKDIQPYVKKTVTPLQERQANTLDNKTTLNVLGGILENHKEKNAVSVPRSKKNTDKSTIEGTTRSANLRNKQVADEAKENDPVVTKKNFNASGVKVLHPSRKEKAPSYFNCTPARSLPSPVINHSPAERCGRLPQAVIDMSVMPSPILANENFANPTNQPQFEKSLHASTPVQSSIHRNQKRITQSLREKTPFLGSPIPTDEFPQSTSLERSLSPGPSAHSKEQHSSDTGSFLNDSDDVLFKPKTMSDIHTAIPARMVGRKATILPGSKPSQTVIPDRMAGRKATILPCSKPPQLDRFGRFKTYKPRKRKQDPNQECSAEGCWRVVPTTRYSCLLEPNLENFGFIVPDTDEGISPGIGESQNVPVGGSPIRTNEFPQSTPVGRSLTPGPSPHSEDQHSTDAGSFHDNSSNLLIECSTDACWRVVPTERCIVPIEPSLENCFGFDDDPDADDTDVDQGKHPVIQKVHTEKPCSQLKICTQPEKSPPPQLQQNSCIQPEKPHHKPQENSSARSEESPCPQLWNDASLPDAKIDEMLSSRVHNLRRKKKDATDSNDNSEPSSSSQLMDDVSRQPVSLVENTEEMGIYQSPFIQPPRRSYANLRPKKRLAVLEEEDNEEDEDEDERSSKRNKTVKKRKKMVQTTLLNQWAKDLSSHFAEVDNVELITE